jgi:hypothetical protein
MKNKQQIYNTYITISIIFIMAISFMSCKPEDFDIKPKYQKYWKYQTYIYNNITDNIHTYIISKNGVISMTINNQNIPFYNYDILKYNTDTLILILYFNINEKETYTLTNNHIF